MRYNDPIFPAGSCPDDSGQQNLRRLADVLGQLEAGVVGSADPSVPANGSTPATRSNHAVAAWTLNTNGAGGQLAFQTSPLGLNAVRTGFYTVSVDVAEASCSYQGGVNNSRLRFAMQIGGVETPISDSPIRACEDPRARYYTSPTLGLGSGWGNAGGSVRAGTFYADAPVLISPEDLAGLQILMRNEAGGSAGNDSAFDNIRVMNVTPQLDKEFSPTVAKTGENTVLTFTVTNTSELAAKNGWSFIDTLTDGLIVADPSNVGGTCTNVRVVADASSSKISATGSLAAGEVSCTITVSVTSDEPGIFTNGPDNVEEVGLNPPGDASVVFQDPALSIEKTAGTPVDVNGNGTTDVGDTIPYSFALVNTGDVTLTDVGVDDLLIPDVTCRTTTLTVGERTTCSGTYTVTAEDEITGSVDNTATATGTPPVGEPVTSAPDNTTTPVVAANPKLTLVKTANVDAVTTEGQIVKYSFAVTNNGNIPVSDITISDTGFTGAGELSDVVCPAGVLGTGDSLTCEASYAVTQEDLDAGGFVNTATANGVPMGGADSVASNESTEKVDAVQTPAISIVKSGQILSEEYVAGAEVVYSFVATNTGNMTLTDIVINEISFSGTGELGEIVCPAEDLVSLAPGKQVVCEAGYKLTQADIDAGEVSNSATATGTPSGDSAPITSEPDAFTFPTPQDASLSIVKTADVDSISEIGQEVVFSFLITNTGNVTVMNPEVVEGEFSGAGEVSDVECPAEAILAPGEFVSCKATYIVTQTDLDSGELTNTATAVGETTGGEPTDPSDPSTIQVPTDPHPSLTVVKTADKSTVAGAGQVITYTFLITNTGNVSITNARAVETQFSGSDDLTAIICIDEAARITPGASVECNATYRTTQADVNAGKVTNTAIASGTPTTGGDPVLSDPSTVTIEVTPGPSLAVTGGETAAGVLMVGLLSIVIGGALIVIRRRREAVAIEG
ncbi:DUF11 domain-containing protein [Microbacterium sp. KSW4-16]|uniref:DUF7507 domain-containing protein n=1 Tax=Microbacterium aurugineum TaxID=2851642 RepID=UPI0020C08202|nr:LPXTG cell wall anchor domain-containing protein [Microbacterium aurugineum]MCK8469046.1 DUF11 domain-containing protein [Microbacterium aurugineum]